MAQQFGSSKAKIEQEMRRKAFEARLRQQASQSNNQRNSNDTTFFGGGFSEWRMRRMAPIAMLIHAMTILLLVSWFFSNLATKVSSFTIPLDNTSLGVFEVPKSGSVYEFVVKQNFPAAQNPLYSELEIQILDENYSHLYSVYKNLWQERYSNGEGGYGIYKDLLTTFEIELPHSGTHYLRPISYNKNNGKVNVNVKKRLIGGIYFKYYSILFGVASLILILGAQKWGSPGMMYDSLKKVRSLKDNMWFIRAAIICTVIFTLVWVTAITHYGYASAGDETVLPTYFYQTNKVIYLG